MSKHRKPYYLFILCAMLAMMTTACFRESAEGAGEAPVAQPLSAATDAEPTPISETRIEATKIEETSAEPTVMPTAAETSVSQISTEAPPDTFALTATVLIQRLTQDAAAPLDTFALTATVLIQRLTQDAAAVAATRPPVSTPVPIIRNTLAPGADCIHQIRAGDTLYTLSQAYGVSVESLTSINSISDPNRILVGQRMTIPKCGTTGFIPPPTSSPTPTDLPLPPTEQPIIAATAAGAEDSAAGDPLVQEAQQRILNNAQINTRADGAAQSEAVPTGSRTYIVRQYDTLYDVAQLFDTTIEEIARLNSITDLDDIRMGDVLQIP